MPVRAVAADGFSNPILYIEELRRIPLACSRVAPPGTALVFRARNGLLRSPPGGWTAGEMFFFGPRTGYRIDTSPHSFVATFETGSMMLVDVAGRWTVTDPVAVVAGRLSDLDHACTAELGRRIAAALPAELPSTEEIRDLLTGAWRDGVAVPGGVRLHDLDVGVARAEAVRGDRVIQYLVADEEDSEPGDPGTTEPAQMVQELAGLARDALAEHGADGAAGRALLRFQDLVLRMTDVLPDGRDGRAGDDQRR
ncbi:hypothetical protein [Actinoplanes sp. N902-109]|uniref:hypothetical protein n=1 Tax=Actinoplanes sp. (strain N902-109) TaxID=649831 RepID=UPI0012FC35C9|nr:hypothetical protein [Actinoplanes sp. N902-109]